MGHTTKMPWSKNSPRGQRKQMVRKQVKKLGFHWRAQMPIFITSPPIHYPQAKLIFDLPLTVQRLPGTMHYCFGIIHCRIKNRQILSSLTVNYAHIRLRWANMGAPRNTQQEICNHDGELFNSLYRLSFTQSIRIIYEKYWYYKRERYINKFSGGKFSRLASDISKPLPTNINQDASPRKKKNGKKRNYTQKCYTHLSTDMLIQISDIERKTCTRIVTNGAGWHDPWSCGRGDIL